MEQDYLRLAFSKSYTGFRLEVDATFTSGVTAVFGPSGSGKTTVLNCIAGFSVPDSGIITLKGSAVYSSKPRVRVPPERRGIGYIFQDGLLFPHMSVGENIRYGYKLRSPDSRAISPDDLTELLGLQHLLERRPGSLSGGEAQRVALARALATSPSLLLLDEPLSSLDMGLRGRVLRYLKVVHAQLSIPMVYVSHSISEVLAISGQALVLDRGRQVAFEPVRDALVKPGVRSLMEGGGVENLLDVVVTDRRPDSGTIVSALGEHPLYIVDPHPVTDGISQGDTISVSIRAGDIIVALDLPPRISAQNILPATISNVHRVESRVLVYADCGVPLVVEVTPEAAASLQLHQGQDAYLIVKSSSVMLMD